MNDRFRTEMMFALRNEISKTNPDAHQIYALIDLDQDSWRSEIISDAIDAVIRALADNYQNTPNL